MKLLNIGSTAGFLIFLFSSFPGMAQTKSPEPELVLSLKLVSGQIRFGANEFYITESDALSIQPGLRYDHPMPGKRKKKGPIISS